MKFKDADSCSGNAIRLPTRAVLNNKTFSLFGGDSMDDVMFSIALPDIETKDDPDSPTCIFVVDTNTKH